MSRFKRVAVFPYSFNEFNELTLLFYLDVRGNAKEVLYDFGCKINQYEPTVYYSAVRSFMIMTKGIFLKNSFAGIKQDISFDEDKLYAWYQAGLEELFYNNKYPLINSVVDNVLAIFYPLPFFKDRDSLNSLIQQADGMQNFEFNWVSIESFDDQSTKSLVSDLNRKFLNENRNALKDIQVRHQEYLEEVAAFDKNRDKNIEEGLHEPIEFKPQLPDYGILWTDSNDVWKFHYPALFIPHLIDSGEVWRTYLWYADDYPTEKELKHLKGFIIPGNIDSPLNDNLDYLPKFIEFVKNVYANYSHIKLIGGCFGHQIITRALGGTVIKLQLDVPIALGKHKIAVTKAFKQMEEFKEWFDEKSVINYITLNRSHSFGVTEMPPGGEQLAKSKYGDYDIYKIGDRVLSFQPHPEFTIFFKINLT